MFEFIGIAVVAWLAWKVLKGLIGGSLKAVLNEAVNHARRHDVPVDYALSIINQPEVLKTARRELARASREFAELPAHEQYGQAIVMMYGSQRRAEDLHEAKRKVRAHLDPQIAALKAEGLNVLVTDITFAYVGALALSLRDSRPVSFQEMREIIEYCFRGKEYEGWIQNAWAIVIGSSDFQQKLAALIPLAKRELAAKTGEYFLKFTRKAHEEPAGSAQAYDPRNVDENWFLQV